MERMFKIGTHPLIKEEKKEKTGAAVCRLKFPLQTCNFKFEDKMSSGRESPPLKMEYNTNNKCLFC